MQQRTCVLHTYCVRTYLRTYVHTIYACVCTSYVRRTYIRHRTYSYVRRTIRARVVLNFVIIATKERRGNSDCKMGQQIRPLDAIIMPPLRLRVDVACVHVPCQSSHVTFLHHFRIHFRRILVRDYLAILVSEVEQ